MASRRKRSKALPMSASDIANIAKSNPYIQRIIEDPKLRKNVTTALNSSKSAYERLTNGKVPARALLEDKKLHADLGRALGAARDVTITMTAARGTRKGLTFGRKLLLVGVGGGLALAGSEKLRSKVLDLLFGAEEEFQYTPPSSASSDTPASTSSVGAA